MSHETIWSYYQTEIPEIFRGSAFRLNYLTRYLHTGDRVLNVGVGGGLFEEFCRRKGVNVFSLDPDWVSLRPHCAAGGGKSAAGRLEALPFADDTFDSVIVSEVLEHLTPESTLEALGEIRRVLVPAGQIVGTVPCEENLTDGIVVCPKCSEVFHKVGHLQSFSTGSMSKLLSTAFMVTDCFKRAFMAKATVGRKETVIDLVRNLLVRMGVFTRENHIVFRAIKASYRGIDRADRLNPHHADQHPIAIYLPSLDGGGAERIMLNLAEEIAKNGHSVDLVLAKTEGALLKDVPANIRVMDLGASRPLTAVPALVRYFNHERPRALLSTITSANIAAILSTKLATVSLRCVVREASNLSVEIANSSTLNRFLAPLIIRQTFVRTHAVVAPSQGVADDLAQVAGVPRRSIQVIYNPVVTEQLLSKSRQSPPHRWLEQPDLPVILGAGRLTRQKDFATLIKAFVLMRERVPARLIILGEGEDRASLERLSQDLGIAEDIDMPGFVANPYPFMSHASLFVLSSRWEGLPGVLIEALACGTKVVSTDCPSGPSEILDNGLYGELCPVGDVETLATIMTRALTGEFVAADASSWIDKFCLKTNAAQYLELLVG